ncbi:MAG TPA: LptF/LptG family permease [Gemmatimonadaceae bacterium]|nr:LptF/LptG family permease [Gemmatimonadaceae bacterium]
MIKRFVWPLDRYVFSEFTKIFAGTALGFPILTIVIDLTDHLQTYIDRKIPGRHIALAYVYYLPESAFMVLPAAVLFATVFAIGGLTRHAEITAAKASGISFHRLILPILLGAVFATCLDLALGEIMPVTTHLRNELLGEELARVGTFRFNFAFAGEYGRVYKATELHTDSGTIRALQIEREGNTRTYPTYIIAADSARYDRRRNRWTLENGEMDVIPDTGVNFALSFQYARDKHFTEMPAALMANPPAPDEMRYSELSRFIEARERSGGDENELRVERALKIAIPCTCLIIALFGAPLATSTQRGGAAYGVAVSLATTVIFLLMIQLTKAVGGTALLPPDFAAWIPGAFFGVIGLVLLARVRT